MIKRQHGLNRSIIEEKRSGNPSTAAENIVSGHKRSSRRSGENRPVCVFILEQKSRYAILQQTVAGPAVF